MSQKSSVLQPAKFVSQALTPDMQLALKLIANATSYGILVEVIVDERATGVPCMVYHGGEVSRRVARKTSLTPDAEFSPGFKVERTGKYFAAYGGLITAGGRLLLVMHNSRFAALSEQETKTLSHASELGLFL